jgi:hypothetical protein
MELTFGKPEPTLDGSPPYEGDDSKCVCCSSNPAVATGHLVSTVVASCWEGTIHPGRPHHSTRRTNAMHYKCLTGERLA